MKLAIHYSAVYQYEARASFSPHLARIFPRQDWGVRVDAMEFRTNEGADVQYRQDLFGSTVARCFYPEEADRLEYQLELGLTVEPRNAFHFLLDAHAVEMPFDYLPQEAAALGPYLTARPVASLPEALRRPGKAGPTVERLVAMNTWLFENITYERRDEGDPLPPEETLRKSRGSCRDYAALLAEALRLQGIAARLASGFMWAEDAPDGPDRARNALHAWVEAYLPGAGWVGLDPTNGQLCDHHFLTTAVGLTAADIAPVSGHYYGGKTFGHTLETNLSVREVKS